MSISNYLESQLINAVWNNAVGDLPVAQPHLKLHTGDPGEDGTNNAAGETTRKSVSVGADAAGTVTSDADMTWTNVASTETYSHVSAWDASSGGNCLWTGALTASKAVTAGDTFTIPSGSFAASID